MSAPEIASLDAELNKLSLSYINELPKKLFHIQALWEKLLFVKWDTAAFELLRRLVHGLVGSAGSQGAPDVGQVARSLDGQLQVLLEQNVPPDDAQRGQINGILQHLARVILEQQSKGRAPERRRVEREVPAPSSTRRLYLLEDDAHQAELLALRFSHYGYAVRTFSTAAELRQGIQRRVPDLILSDVMLPQGPLAGIEAIAALREEVAHDIPVLFMSARGDLAARLAAVRAGAAGYFLKPLDIDELFRRVDELMQRQVSNYKVLIVDDEEQLASTYALVLQQAGLVTKVLSQPLQILQVLYQFRPDLVLMDLHLPGCTGVELMHLIRQDADNASLPIVFVSGETDPVTHNKVLGQGADLFLMKPVAPEQLVAAVANRVGRAHALSRRIHFLSQQDPLTGLLNHRAFLGHLDNHVAEMQGGEVEAALIYIEVDQARNLRDKLGIAVADLLLADLAARIKERLYRASHLAYLMDGCFCALVRGIGLAEARELAEKLAATIAADVFSAERESVSMTLSLGISPLSAKYSDGAAWMSMAALACDIARQAGGNRVELQREVADDLAVKEHNARCAALLREALDGNKFYCLYQPIASLRGKPVERYDVLLRVRDADGREIPAARILDVANAEGLLTQLDRWVVQHVLGKLKSRAQTGGKTVFFIKLSGQSLGDAAFADWLEAVLKAGDINGRQLVFEVTESDASTAVRAANQLFSRLRRLGCGIALEHFGASLSAAQLLSHLPVDYVKIDASFVRDLVTSPANRDSVRSILSQAGEAGAMVIAGFVEDASSLGALWQCGVHFIQGNFLQEPDERLGFDFSDELCG